MTHSRSCIAGLAHFIVLSAALAVPATVSAQFTTVRHGESLRPFGSNKQLAAYLGDLARRRDEMLRAAERARCNATSTITRRKLAPVAGRRPASAVVSGLVRDIQDDRPVAGAQALSAPMAAPTDANGRFRLVLPNVTDRKSKVSVRIRAIGYEPRTEDLELAAGDSLHIAMKLCRASLKLSAAVVSGTAFAGGPGITNVQEAGVDEGGLVKLAGDYLIILRRGRLYSVKVGEGALQPVAAINAFPPPLAKDNAWYDEMLVYRDRIVVLGYSYRRSGAEIGLFRLDPSGGITHEATYNFRAHDYYSSRNYSSRLIGSTLAMYTPLYLAEPDSSLPAMRRWDPNAESKPLQSITTASRVYRPPVDPDPMSVGLHSITTCDLAAADFQCKATVVIGAGGRVTYASATAMYVWTESFASRGSVAYRIPFLGAAPRALRVDGMPIDQFSFREDADGFLNVFVVNRSRGEAMWGSEAADGDAALLRIGLDRFGDGSSAAPGRAYRRVSASTGWSTQNRFVGDWLLFGGGNGWGTSRRLESALTAVPVQGGAEASLPLPHGVDRIERLGNDAVVIGTGSGNLHFTGIGLDGTPRLAQSFVVPGASQGELRSHGFFYAAVDPGTGVLGLPIRESNRPGFSHLREGSASIAFVRNDGRAFHGLGSLAPVAPRNASDECVASCVDWYGNARPIFLGDRILALLGYELVEGVIRGNGIVEVRRASFQR